jgi:antirestriction protein ArdC
MGLWAVLEATDGFHLPTAILGWTVRICRRNERRLLRASLGIVPTVRHADYIGSWLEVLREDNRAIVRAASQASKAADWLLGFVPADGAALSAEPAIDRRAA